MNAERAVRHLGRAGVRAGGVEFGEDGDLRPFAGLQRGHQPCPAGPDDDRVVLMADERPAHRSAAHRLKEEGDVEAEEAFAGA